MKWPKQKQRLDDPPSSDNQRALDHSPSYPRMPIMPITPAQVISSPPSNNQSDADPNSKTR
jgi:hypothetical protein